MFCLFFDAATHRVRALNGSGRSSANLDLEALTAEVESQRPVDQNEASRPAPVLHHLSPHAVTVPGAAGGWIDTVERFGSGRVSLEEILMPAVELAEGGWPVSEISAEMVRPLFFCPFGPCLVPVLVPVSS